MPPRKKASNPLPETTARHLWLAGLGAIVLARRTAVQAANDAFAQASELKQLAARRLGDSRDSVRERIANAREQGESRVGQFSAEVEARLAPVLGKLGLKPATNANRRARKPVASKRGRPASRKPVAKNLPRKRRA